MKLVFFDLETTGANPGKNGIHQISGMVEIDGVEKERFDFHVQPNPKALIEEQALAVAGVNRLPIPSNDNPLPAFTPRELMQELFRRGYEGELTYISRINIAKM